MKKWLNRILEWMFASVLVAVGLLGVFHEVLHRVGVEPKNPESFVLRIVGLLAMALGLERFTRFAHIERHFSSLEKQVKALHTDLNERLPVRVIEGYDHVYSEAIRMFETAESTIRTLVFAKGPTAPERFFQALIRRMQQEKFLTYHVTIAVDLATAPAELWRVTEERTAIQKQAGIGDRVQVMILDTSRPVGFDVMVVDERHCAMALSAVPVPELNKEVSIHIENHPQVAKRIGSWLDNLNPQLIPVEEARKRWQKKHRTQASAN